MIISKTPFRISFFGGGTDFPAWFQKEKGAVLSTTIDKYCYISLRRLPPFFYHKHRIVYSEIELVEDIASIKHPSVRECFRSLNITEGLEVHYDGDLPSRSGLGSSSSFSVGLIHALKAYQGQMIDKKRLAELAILIERTILQEKGGLQDQIAVSHGGFNRIDFTDEGYTLKPIVITPLVKKDLEQSLCLFFTGKSRLSDEIEKEKIQNLSDNKARLHLLYEMVQEGISLLSKKEFSAKEFGTLLDEAWRYKKTLASSVSNSHLNDIYAQAISEGAYGGKLLGAGGGGFFLFCVENYKRESFIEAMSKVMVHVPFKFETQGSHIILYAP